MSLQGTTRLRKPVWLDQAPHLLASRLAAAVSAGCARLRQAWLARQPRERSMLLLALAVVCGGLIERCLWAPAEHERKLLTRQLQQHTEQRNEARMRQAQALADTVQLQARERALRERVDAADKELAAMRESVTPAAQMLKRLRQFSSVEGRLKLAALTLEPAEPVLTPGAAPASAPATRDAQAPGTPASGPANAPRSPAVAQAKGGGLYRLPVVVTVEGDYAAITAYLEQLEAAPGGLRWRTLQLQTSGWPTLRLTLRVYTLGEQSSWPV